MLEIKDWLYIIGGAIALLASHFKLENKISVVETDMINHKDNHNKLEAKVMEHENKIDSKLSSLDTKIDSKHEIINEKIDSLRTLIIDRLK